ncbi:MAG: 3-dehydroquinate synthase [Acidobacteriota bacterium]
MKLGARSYRVRIGSATRLIPEVLGAVPAAARHVVADARVVRIHPAVVEACASGRPAITVSPGERSKSFAMAERIASSLARRGADRSAVIVAIGGGVVGDLAGFVASIYQRGVAVVQVPTTLLAQVDASVGGKTAVNLGEGKNLAGTFHQPRAVVVDPSLVATLLERDRNAGLAELLKAAALDGGAFWRGVRGLGGRLAEAPPRALEELVARAISYKARIVAADERESGLRRVLNLGHTLAHALETATAYRHYRHGEAVAAGLCFAAAISERRAGLSRADADALCAAAAPLARRAPRSLDPRSVERLFGRDKKTRAGVTSWVLLAAPGRPVIDAGVGKDDLR